MRTLNITGALVAAAACSLLLAPAAHATNGDNGTVKIHDSKTGEEIRANQPKVCEFYLDAFGFDATQKVNWHIEAWANNDLDKGTEVKAGTFTLDETGHGRTEDMKLADGQYKLVWNWEGEKGKAKHKVFKSECEDDKPTDKPTEPTDKPTEPTGNPSDNPSENPSAQPSSSAPGGAKPGASPSDSATGDLAETGSSAPVGALAGVAAALVAGGAFLVLRRRKAGQH
ncbi:PT domain-containing protein [Streptomyces sp. NPDC047928]|uniref:PT domain-containing protein n=1 Tax=unclassified Streptomyces TaxID=2593676 RepID=UPI00371A52EA